MSAPVEDKLAKERDLKFKLWLQNKAVKDKAFEYLSQLDPDRASKTESLFEIAISLIAIERLLGPDPDSQDIELKKNTSNDGGVGENKDDTPKKKKTLKDGWIALAQEKYAFEDLKLSSAEVAQFSSGMEELIKSEFDMHAYEENAQEYSKTRNILQHLKYNFVGKTKPKEKPKALTNDQLLQNKIFIREVRNLWKKADYELSERIIEFVARQIKFDTTSEQKSNNRYQSDYETETEKANKSKKLELKCLNELGLKQFKVWLEQDEEKKKQDENIKNMEHLKLRKQAHDEFIMKKDSVRIRIPTNLTPFTAPSMGYGREIIGVRATPKGVGTTIDLMAGQGFKYVHATYSKKAKNEDLEKSRKQLLDMGFVNKENFKDSQGKQINFEEFQRERNENTVIQERTLQEQKTKQDSALAYEEWSRVKEMKDHALKCLELKSKPNLVAIPAHDDLRGSTQGRNSQQFQPTSAAAALVNINTTNVMKSKDNRHIVETCLQVGKALKRVDRTLFKEWATWSEGVLSMNSAAILWDFFPPMACDVHATAYSQIRDAFLKLLKPGMDYRQTFIDFVNRTSFAKHIDNMGLTEPDEIEAERKDYMNKTASLSKDEMSRLLRSMGIAMKETDLKSLIEAFDNNGDGRVTLAEFLDFTGPKRDKRSGQSLSLSQRCSWLNTCNITGMSGAFSAPTSKNSKDLKTSTTSIDDIKNKVGNVVSVWRKKTKDSNYVYCKENDEEKIMFLELKERKKREDFLYNMELLSIDAKGVLGNDAKSSNQDYDDYDNHNAYEEDDDAYANPKKNNTRNTYDDDFEDDDVDHSSTMNSKQKSLSSQTKKIEKNSCGYASWTLQDRKKGLNWLLTFTKEEREEETLKNLLANGVPPLPPKCWVQNEKTLETYSTIRKSSASIRSHDSRVNPDSTELTIYWGPQRNKDLVSFYSLEYAGPVSASKTGDVKYTEIFRDPTDAKEDFVFNFRMSDLLPGVSYRFRIRAFNGFGAGEYTYKTFTTITSAPVQPRVIKVTSDSVSLKWTFSQGFFQRMEELKKIFVLADKDNSKMVSREELAFVLNEKASDTPELRKFLDKVVVSKGLEVNSEIGGKSYEALFDMIEGDDDGGLSWSEFETFFLAAGWGHANIGGINASQYASHATLKKSAPTTSNVVIAPGDLNYIVERCESEFDEKYTEVIRTSLGHATITRLEPGKSYRFRVHSLNADGVPGPCSPPVLVHTLVETPSLPVPANIQVTQNINSSSSVSKLGIYPNKIILSWRARNYITGTRTKAFTDRMLGEWAGAFGDDEGGVSIRAAFDKYDHDKSGDIDAAELKHVLEDLGVEASEERLNEAFDVLDSNGDGIISYEEFGKWWRRDAVTYTLKRSVEVIPTISTVSLANTRNVKLDSATVASETRSVSRGKVIPTTSSAVLNAKNNILDNIVQSTNKISKQQAVPIVTYRGSKTKYEVLGLTPNRLYHFKLRYVGSRSNSILSPPLVIMTAPIAPSAPILVDVTSNSVRLKWYASKYGAFKFVVHMRQKVDMNIKATTSKKIGTSIIGLDTGEDGWVAVYNGSDNVFMSICLPSDTTFEARVFAANCQGTLSDPSDSITFSTMPRKTDKDVSENAIHSILTPKNAMECFTIECTGDICVGDTILITERLYVKNKTSSDDRCISGTGRSITASSSSKSRPKSATGINTYRGGGSITQSITSLNGDGVSITAERGQFLGERTIAGYVSKDNYRTIRDNLNIQNIEPKSTKKFGLYRNLWLEVVWQKSSNESCKPYDLKAGDVLERNQAHLEQFEVFRIKWKQESMRKPLQEEWKVMMECFVQTDC